MLNQRLRVKSTKVEDGFSYFRYDIENIGEPWAVMSEISRKIMVEYPICHNTVKESNNLIKLLKDTYHTYIYEELGITNDNSPYIVKWEE